ncbi:unnamed protein product [marine sediment metagenome]|uniref:Uncharacterized protein n=1 Tax=marine sediment metagenome TaxID=412755 RepID=X1D283_9ZZZZ
MAKTVKCKYHGVDLPIVKKGNKLVAVCNCPTKTVKNRFAGQVVFEEAAPVAKKKKGK